MTPDISIIGAKRERGVDSRNLWLAGWADRRDFISLDGYLLRIPPTFLPHGDKVVGPAQARRIEIVDDRTPLLARL